MKKIFLLSLSFLLITSLFAQNPDPTKKKQTINLSGRANDHFLLQLGYTGWAGKPDSISPSGFSKSINVYFMFDFPFKTNPKLSMAFGPGISTDNIIFKKTFVGIKENSTVFQIRNDADTMHFKRTKLVTAYLEAPIEFRYTANPMNSDNSFKFALGVKVGTMINAHTRNKDLEDKNETSINPYIMKESSKRFFNTTRLSAQARVGLGHLSLYGSYQITTLLKDGAGAEIRPYSIGITLSGL
jgi:Outer membrane protein beta-barrel domain